MKHLADPGFPQHTFENTNTVKSANRLKSFQQHVVSQGQTLNFWMALNNLAPVYLPGLSLVCHHTLSYSQACARELLVNFSGKASLGPLLPTLSILVLLQHPLP